MIVHGPYPHDEDVIEGITNTESARRAHLMYFDVNDNALVGHLATNHSVSLAETLSVNREKFRRVASIPLSERLLYDQRWLRLLHAMFYPSRPPR